MLIFSEDIGKWAFQGDCEVARGEIVVWLFVAFENNIKITALLRLCFLKSVSKAAWSAVFIVGDEDRLCGHLEFVDASLLAS